MGGKSELVTGELYVQHHRRRQTYSKLQIPIWYRVAKTAHHIQIWVRQGSQGGLLSVRICPVDGQLVVVCGGRIVGVLAEYRADMVEGSEGVAHNGSEDLTEAAKQSRAYRRKQAYLKRVEEIRGARS